MTAITPPGFRKRIASRTACSSPASSPLTSTRLARNVPLAGCGPSRLAAAGIAFLIISASSVVGSMGLSARAAPIAFEMRESKS